MKVLTIRSFSDAKGILLELFQHGPPIRETMSAGRHLIIAVVLFAIEVLLGIGLIGGGIGMIVAIVVLFSAVQGQPPLRKRLRLSTIYACLFAATLTLLHFNWRLSQRRATPVIAACREFQAQRGRYPDQLTELVPRFLPSVPEARYTLIGRRFAYDQERPSLCFAAMFHGIVCYDFPTDKWKTND